MNNVRQKTINPLAWFSFLLALCGGVAATVSWMGVLISGAVGLGPTWLAPVLWLVGFVWTVLDLWLDWTPNKPAVWSAILLPSISLGVQGQVGEQLGEVRQELNRWLTEKTNAWFGFSGPIVIALACSGTALVIARRVVKSAKEAKAVAEAQMAAANRGGPR